MSLPALAAALLVEEPEGGHEITDSTLQRRNIGGSSIGSHCGRAVALRLRGFPADPVRPRLKRIFAMGHQVEAQLIKEVRDKARQLGLRLVSTGKLYEQREFSYMGEIFSAHGDGVLIDANGSEYLLEIKSANDSSFQATARLGLKYAHQEYYDQMQIMMGLGGMKLGLLVMMNKNDGELHAEIIAFDEIIFNYLKARVSFIASSHADHRCAKTRANFRCSMCLYQRTCWDMPAIPKDERTCRHCAHATASDAAFAICNHPSRSDRPITEYSAIEAELGRYAIKCEDYEDYRTRD